MKVIANKTGGLAISPQKIVHFNAGDILEPGIKGLSEENIARLIELKFVDVEGDTFKVKPKIINEIEPTIDSLVIPDAYDFESFTDKDELLAYAKEIYDIELDNKLSVKKMIATLKKTIEGDK